MPDTARLVKLLDAAESNMFWSRIRNSIPGAKLEMHGISRLALPIASPLESGRRKISTNPASIFPADPCGLLSGFRPIAMPQLYADSLLPVPGDEKPPKLLIRSCSPRFRMLPMTDEKMPVGRLWHDIFVMVRQGAHVRRSENGKPTG